MGLGPYLKGLQDFQWPLGDLTAAWIFFDMNVIFDEYVDEPSTVVKTDYMSRLHFVSSFSCDE